MRRTAARLAAVAVGVFVGLGLAFEPSDAQTPGNGTVAFTGARNLIDGTGKAPIEQGTIVVTNGRITAVGPSASVTVPAGVTRIDAAGKTIIPGLINAHGHVTTDDYSKLPRRQHMMQILQAYAEYGVTTTTNLGSSSIDDETESLKIRDEQRKGTPDRTRLFDAGKNAIGTSPQEARASVVRLADAKVDLIKYHINGNAKDMTPDIYGALVDEAKKRGYVTTVHIFNLRDAKGAIEKGTDALVHSRARPECRSGADRYDEAQQCRLRADADARPVCLRLRERAGLLAGAVLPEGPVCLQDPGRHPEGCEDAAGGRNSPAVQRIKVALEQAKRNLKLLSDAGVTIGMGTDTASPNDLGRWPGYFEHTEMEMMT